ncbi:hypothetical protein, partial [Burkholderia cenocepacia]|uniref:hypothetical protein n=1 Tax=Burkholderia cenocepacia TaxID=95486 RepID=UPI001955395F
DAYGPASAIVSISAIRADRMTVLASLVDLFPSSRGNRLPLVLEKPCGIRVCKDERWSAGEYLPNFGFE